MTISPRAYCFIACMLNCPAITHQHLLQHPLAAAGGSLVPQDITAYMANANTWHRQMELLAYRGCFNFVLFTREGADESWVASVVGQNTLPNTETYGREPGHGHQCAIVRGGGQERRFARAARAPPLTATSPPSVHLYVPGHGREGRRGRWFPLYPAAAMTRGSSRPFHERWRWRPGMSWMSYYAHRGVCERVRLLEGPYFLVGQKNETRGAREHAHARARTRTRLRPSRYFTGTSHPSASQNRSGGGPSSTSPPAPP